MKILLITLVLFLAGASLAQKSALDNSIIIDPGNYRIDVYVPPQSINGSLETGNWTVIAIDSSKNVKKVIVKPQASSDNSLFSLIPEDQSLIKNAVQVIVNFDDKTIVLPPIKKPKQGNNATAFKPATNKQNSDVYLSFTYSPAIHQTPAQYSIDGSVAAMFDLDKKHLSYGQLGFVGAVSTDKRKRVDPDSYRIFLAYQNTPYYHKFTAGNFTDNNTTQTLPKHKTFDRLQGVMFTWLAAGAEFDRKGKNANFITAPYLDFPIRLFPRFIRANTQPMAVLTPTVGLETGYNFHNSVTPNTGHGIFRGVVGANLFLRFMPSNIPSFKGIEFTSAYILRLPAFREVYTLTKTVDGKDTDVPSLNTKPRHYVKSEFDYKLNKSFSIALKDEWGAIPPLFRKVDHKLSFGFTFSVKQTNEGVPSTIRNK